MMDRFFVILDSFFPFYPANNSKNQNFEKLKKASGDIIILHMCTINDSHIFIYGSWDMEHDRHNFLSFWTFFYPFTPLTTPKNQNFEKLKKMPRYIIILNKCLINDHHMMNGSWDIERDRPNFLLFWTIFCLFTALKAKKIKIKKKEKKKRKKSLEIWSVYKVYQKSWSYAVLFLRYSAWQM